MDAKDTLKERVQRYTPLTQTEAYALEAIREALAAAESGSYGVGAVLVDEETNTIVCRGRNKVFTQYRSDLHAEMDLLDTFENQHGEKSREMLRNLTLYTSLESCPMCLCRIISSGVSKVFHIAYDERGGMVHLYNQLPITWQEISQDRVFEKAACSQELSEIAFQIFLETVDLDKEL